MNEALRNEIVRRWREGASQRAIASVPGMTRATVKRVLSKHEAERNGESSEPVRRSSLLDAYETVIGELVGRKRRGKSSDRSTMWRSTCSTVGPSVRWRT